VIHAALQGDSTGRARILGEHDPPRAAPKAPILDAETNFSIWNQVNPTSMTLKNPRLIITL
jgi:hypothetical protein